MIYESWIKQELGGVGLILVDLFIEDVPTGKLFAVSRN